MLKISRRKALLLFDGVIKIRNLHQFPWQRVARGDKWANEVGGWNLFTKQINNVNAVNWKIRGDPQANDFQKEEEERNERMNTQRTEF